jgi:GxxExxY protein
MEFDRLSHRVIGCALEVHRHLGPGLLESVYEQCLSHELSRNGVAHELQHRLPIRYKEVQLDCGYRIDVFVENSLIIELKSIEQIHPIHEAQVLTYMRLAGVKTGLLVNFNVPILKEGLKRFVF